MNASQVGQAGQGAPGVERIESAGFGDYDYAGNYAPWWRRVVAVLLDSALASVFVIALFGPSAGLSIIPRFAVEGGNEVDGDAAFTPGGWYFVALVVVLLAFLACQGYWGATPGKRAVRIVVVGEATGKPIGLASTALRWLAHFLDAILMIGYLRPLWNRQEKTFADSLLHTVVLHGPLPARFRAHAGDIPNPRRESQALTLVALFVCLGAVVFTLGPRADASRMDLYTCQPQTTAAGEDLGVRLRDVDLRVVANTQPTLWGITWKNAGDWVGVRWTWDNLTLEGGALAQAVVEADFSVRAPGWSESRTFSGNDRVQDQSGWATWQRDPGLDDVPEEGEWEEPGGGTATAVARTPHLKSTDLVRAGRGTSTSWEWSSTLRADGVVVAQCSGRS